MLAGDHLRQGGVKPLHPEPIKADFRDFRIELSSRRRKNVDARNALNSALAGHRIGEPENGAPRHVRPSASLFQVSKSSRTNELRGLQRWAGLNNGSMLYPPLPVINVGIVTPWPPNAANGTMRPVAGERYLSARERDCG